MSHPGGEAWAAEFAALLVMPIAALERALWRIGDCLRRRRRR